MSKNQDAGSVAVTVLVIALAGIIMTCQSRAAMRCEAKDGTYLWREAKCIDARTIR